MSGLFNAGISPARSRRGWQCYTMAVWCRSPGPQQKRFDVLCGRTEAGTRGRRWCCAAHCTRSDYGTAYAHGHCPRCVAPQTSFSRLRWLQWRCVVASGMGAMLIIGHLRQMVPIGQKRLFGTWHAMWRPPGYLLTQVGISLSCGSTMMPRRPPRRSRESYANDATGAADRHRHAYPCLRRVSDTARNQFVTRTRGREAGASAPPTVPGVPPAPRGPRLGVSIPCRPCRCERGGRAAC